MMVVYTSLKAQSRFQKVNKSPSMKDTGGGRADLMDSVYTQ